MNTLRIPILAAIAASLALQVAAQTGRTNPPDIQAPTVPLRYESAFSDYKPYQDLPMANWRQVNDAVLEAASAAATSGGDGTTVSPGLPGSVPTQGPGQDHDAHHMKGAKP
jgi:hypothetical protein